MSHLPFTLSAYFLNALSVLASKFLLKRSIPDPLVYIFYISLVSLLAILALPFTKIPSISVFSLASLSTLFWTLGAYLMYKALKIGAVSRVIPVIGTVIPLVLLGFAAGTNVVSQNQIWAVLILVAGMVFLTATDWKGKGGFSKKELLFELTSAASFALAYLLLRQAYLNADFFSVIVWSRLILLPFAISMFIFPSLRKKIVSSDGTKINFFSKDGLVFVGGQLSGALSEFLLLFSISLANPALVNSLQGTQYVFLFIFAIFLGKKYPQIFEEKYTLLTLVPKLLGIASIGLGLYLLATTNG